MYILQKAHQTYHLEYYISLPFFTYIYTSLNALYYTLGKIMSWQAEALSNISNLMIKAVIYVARATLISTHDVFHKPNKGRRGRERERRKKKKKESRECRSAHYKILKLMPRSRTGQIQRLVISTSVRARILVDKTSHCKACAGSLIKGCAVLSK